MAAGDARLDRVVDTPQAAMRRGARRLLLGSLLGALLIVSLAFWLEVVRSPVSAEQYTPPKPPVPLPTTYYDTVEGQIAQGLALTTTQVKAAIVADQGEGLFGVATERGVSPDALDSIEIGALQTASDQMTASGQWTQAQDDATMQFWRARGSKALGSDMTDWFLHH